ncbi:MAG: hypothetical protein JNL12_07260 [Planctomycetes bacterium]|nr:hypothetical protein [Planctomycetota bacterium]
MTVRNFSDQGFDDYRRERKRMRAKIGPQPSTLGYENQALRELEQVEAREIQDQRLTREVHDFFAMATRQAAAIVERVARDAQQEAGQKVEQEMESFLIDALARMNNFVLTVLHHRRAGVAETQVEPRLGNLEEGTLDEFRWSGTAEGTDKHIGQDPFSIDLEDVRREFRTQVGESGEGPAVAVPIDQHLVAAVSDDAADDSADEATGEPEAEPAPTAKQIAAAPKAAASAAAPKVESSAAAGPAASKPSTSKPAPNAVPAAEAAPGGANEDLERFKSALKALVRQGVMSREEARAAWQARLQALGQKG